MKKVKRDEATTVTENEALVAVVAYLLQRRRERLEAGLNGQENNKNKVSNESGTRP